MNTEPPEDGAWTDREWLIALRAERDDAWALLRHKIRVGLLAYTHGRAKGARGPDTLVEDATQDALVAVRAKLDTFRFDSRFTTWVYRIAINVYLGQLRRQRWEGRRTELSTSPPERPFDDASANPERAAESRETWNFVRRVIEHDLTAHQRTIILAHVFDRKPLDLVAADLGITRDAAYKAIHDGRLKLRAAFIARGFTLDRARKIFDR